MPRDPWGSGDASHRTKMERAATEIIRRTKLEARNDPNFVPPPDAVSNLLAAKRYIVAPPLTPPGPDDANSVLAVKTYARTGQQAQPGLLIAPHMISPVVDAGTLTMNDAIVYAGSATPPATTVAYVTGDSGDLLANVPAGSKHSFTVHGVEIVRVVAAGLALAVGKLFGTAANLTISNAAGTQDNVVVDDATGDMTVFGAVTAPTFIGDLSGNAATATAFSGAPANVTGSRGGNVALASLLSALAGQGLITDSTTP
jgi:hypothetical protein